MSPYCSKNELNCFVYIAPRKTVGKSSKKILKLIKNTSPNKLGNLESLKNLL